MKNNFQKSSPTLLRARTIKPQISIHQIYKLPKSFDTSWLTIHNQFSTYGRNAKEWMRKCALLLPEIERQQIWRKKRFHNIYDYAAKLAGMSREQVNDALWILNKIKDKPALLKVVEIKGLNAIRPIISIATQENAIFLAEKATIMSNHTLRAYAKGINQGLLTSSKNEQFNRLDFRDVTTAQSANLQIEIDDAEKPADQNCLPKITILIQLDPQVADQLQKIKGQADWNETIRELLKLREEKLEQEKPKTVENATRPIPTKIEKYAIAKTNSTCAFPSCTKPYEILHHTDRFAQYHTHDPDRIIPLCKAHENLAHLGLIENENQPPENWRLRAQPDYDDPKYEVDRIVGRFRQQS
ncbi:MAG: hypothetical protein NTZ25_04755 [Candidatus Peregrinibacteria bacterium]|nr:hypothetical protein [Candidatus Peregrinibacteria bacterium]